MVAKRRRARGKISSLSAKKRNQESNTKDDTDPDKTNNKYSLQFPITIRSTSYWQLNWVIYLFIK